MSTLHASATFATPVAPTPVSPVPRPTSSEPQQGITMSAVSGTDAASWVSGNTAKLLVGYPAATQAIVDAVRGAKELVNVTMFSLQPTGHGARLGEALLDRAKAGVEVNLVVDFVGSAQIPGTPWWSNINNLRKAGANVLVTNPIARNEARRHIDHRKMVGIDGNTAFIGGMNFGSMFDDWTDIMVKLQGPVAAQAGGLFASRWKEMGGTVSARHQAALDRGLRTPAPGGTITAALMSNAPDSKRHDITKWHLDSIGKASSRIWLSTPFIGDHDVVQALAAAAKRGVDVRVMTSGGNLLPVPAPIGQTLSRTFFPELLAAGVKVIETAGTTHAKSMLVDDHVTVGSYNATKRAGYHDHELNVLFRDAGSRAQVEKFFTDSFASGTVITPDKLDGKLQRAFTWLRNRTKFNY